MFLNFGGFFFRIVDRHFAQGSSIQGDVYEEIPSLQTKQSSSFHSISSSLNDDYLWARPC
jgi:hypothetical protein